MLIKTLESRVVCQSREELDALRLTSAVFASCVGAFVRRYVAALRGQPSARYRTLVRRLLSEGGPNVYGIVDGLSAERWRSASGSPLHALAREIRDTEGLWFDRFQELARHEGIPVRTTGYSQKGPLPGAITISPEMYRQAANCGIWYLRGLFTARKSWRAERRDWLDDRRAFLEKHPAFADALNRWIVPFEAAFTRARSPRGPARQHGRRWDRWQLWYDWLVSHPECAGWRDPEVTLALPTGAELAELERRTRHSGRRSQLRLGLLLAKNPELAALEELHLEWVRTFLRFRRPPRLRVPGEDAKAPAWVVPRQHGYRDLDPKKGSVALQVLFPDEHGTIAPRWHTYRIRTDPRFAPAVRARRGLPALASDAAGRGAVQEGIVAGLDQRRAGISGLSLIERHGTPYLVASIPTSLPALRVRFGHRPGARVAADRLVDNQAQPVLSARLLALHLGTEPLASYVASVIERPEPGSEWTARDLARGSLRVSSAPTFRQLAQDDLRRRRKTAQWGTLPRGQRFDRELSEHREHSMLERQRSGAAAIVRLAQEHDVDMILVDDPGLRAPTAAASRDRNRFLALAGHRGLVEWLEHLARDVGIALGYSPAARSSTFCSRCGLPGFRFRVRRKNASREGVARRAEAQDFGRPELDPAGPEFRCPHCERTENAGVNAARNHVWRLLHGKLAGLRYHTGSASWTLPDGRSRWNPAVAAAAWFERLTASALPTTTPDPTR